MANTRTRRTVGILVVVGGLVGVAAALGAKRAAEAEPQVAHAAPPAPRVEPPAPPPAPTPPAPNAAFTMPKCDGAPATPTVAVLGNPEARKAAQRGIEFLEREAVAWQKQNACYGCHVQAVTVEALSVGFAHQYEIRTGAFNTILGGMLRLDGGAHGPMGLFHFNPEIGHTAKVLGAAAFARYDQHVGDKVRRELLAEARRVRARQQKNGAVTLPWTSPPIVLGTVQG